MAAKADNVINYNDYFLFNKDAGTIDKGEGWKKSPEALEYNDYGAVKDGVVGGQGSFSFYLACLLRGDDGLYSAEQELASFTFDLSVSDKGSFALLPYLTNTVTYLISNNGSSYNSSFDTNKTVKITCTDASLLSASRLFYKITLNFDFSSVLKTKTFKSSVADQMGNANLAFSVSVGE